MRRRNVLALGGALGAGFLLRLAASLATAPVAVLGAAAGPGPSLLFVFQPEDCPSYRGLVERWNTVHEKGEVGVVGVALGFPEDPDGREAAIARSGVRFPVRVDLAAAAERRILRLGFDRTPVSLLLDAEGRPRLAFPPVRDPEAWGTAQRLVEEYARLLAPTPPLPR